MMRPIAAWLLAGSFVVCLGCGDDDKRPGGLSNLGGSGGGGGTTTGGAGGENIGGEAGTGPGGAGNAGEAGVGGVGATAGTGGGTGGSGAELGSLPIEVVPDGNCVPAGGTSKEVYDAASAPNFTRLDLVGGRRIAGGSLAVGAYLMDADGGSPSSNPISVTSGQNLFASEGDTFGLVGRGSELSFGRYDALGEPVLEPFVLANEAADSMTIVGRDGESLVVWAREGAIWARGVGSSGPIAPAFQIATNAYKSTAGLHAAVSDSGFVVSWTGDDEFGRYRTNIALTTLDSLVGYPAVIIMTLVRHAVIRLVRVDDGFAMAVAGAPPESPYYVLSLDGEGYILGSAKELEGVVSVGDLAGVGQEFGVLATRPTGEPQFRPFDKNLEPLGGWVCLDGPSSGFSVSALSADGTGYAAVFKTSTGAVNLARFDRLGTGP
jgi:hypothetical protein